jgi:hypothetical protein
MRKSGRLRAVSNDAQIVRGCIDGVSPAGIISGWCAGAPDAPARRLAIMVDGAVAIDNVACAIFREDLRAAGIGDGHHGFRVEIPAASRRPAAEALVEVLDQDTSLPIAAGVRVVWNHRPSADLEGHVDSISEEGMILGWCWDRADPARRVLLNVLADGTQVGTTVAGLYRDDLRAAGKGEGHCGFSFFLPWQAISLRAEVGITLQDSESGLPVGPRTTLRRPQILTAEQRIEALERQLQLVRAELQTAEARALRAEDARLAPDLFKVVAAFFNDLAQGKPRAGLVGLRTRLDDVAHRLRPVSLGSPRETDTTILVLPDGDVDRLHTCLSALNRAGADSRAQVVLLDSGEGDGEDLALIHAAVRHARVLCLRPEETINDLLRAIKTPYIALLPCHVDVAEAWLDELTGRLRLDQGVGIAASQLLGVAGQPANTALVADPVHGLRPSHAPAAAAEADALDDLCLCLRSDMLWQLGGLDLAYGALPAQVVDLCLRARRSGWRIAFSNRIVGRSCEGSVSALDRISAEDMERLRAACEANAGSSKPGVKDAVVPAPQRGRRQASRS